jgi:hypothetical protein
MTCLKKFILARKTSLMLRNDVKISAQWTGKVVEGRLAWPSLGLSRNSLEWPYESDNEQQSGYAVRVELGTLQIRSRCLTTQRCCSVFVFENHSPPGKKWKYSTTWSVAPPPPDFRKSVALWTVPRLCPFVDKSNRQTKTREWSIGGVTLTTENRSTRRKSPYPPRLTVRSLRGCFVGCRK